MKVGLVFESEMYMNGIENYLHSSIKEYLGIKRFTTEELKQNIVIEKLLRSISSWELLVVDYKSYGMVLSLIELDPSVLNQFNGKVVLVRLGSDVAIERRDFFINKYNAANLVVDLTVAPSISKESFVRQIRTLLMKDDQSDDVISGKVPVIHISRMSDSLQHYGINDTSKINS